MKSQRTIALITPGFPASAEDSTCLPLLQALVRAWGRSGVRVVVITLHYPYHTAAYTLGDAEVIPLAGRNRGGWRRIVRARKVQQLLARLHRQHGLAGIVSCWYGETAVAGERFARRAGIPHYCWLLGQDARATNSWPRRLRLSPQQLVALSQSVQRIFQKEHGVLPLHLIEPGTDVDIVSGLPHRDCLVLGVGSLIALKRWSVFLQVIASLYPLLPNLRAIVVGDGPDEMSLRQETERLGLAQIVAFPGSLPYREVLRLMARARLLLHPSEYEGYSGVCQEALSVGTPVLSVCRPSDQLPPGWETAPDAPSLAQRAIRLLENPKGVAPQHFQIDDTARQWLRLLKISAQEEATAMTERAMAPNEK